MNTVNGMNSMEGQKRMKIQVLVSEKTGFRERLKSARVRARIANVYITRPFLPLN